MIGYAVSYPPADLMRLAAAFERWTGDRARLVMFTNMPRAERRTLQALFKRLVLLHPDNVSCLKLLLEPRMKIDNPAFRRYVVIRDWLRCQKTEFHKVIMTDTRDIALFGNPFSDLGPSVQVYTEVVNYKYDERYNQVWIRSCYGENFLNEILHERVTCCGVVTGSGGAIMEYLDAFVSELREKHTCHRTGADTAIHVWIIHKVLNNVRVVDSDFATITHAPKWGKNATFELDQYSKFDREGKLLNKLNMPYTLIHQADRFPRLWDPYRDQFG